LFDAFFCGGILRFYILDKKSFVTAAGNNAVISWINIVIFSLLEEITLSFL